VFGPFSRELGKDFFDLLHGPAAGLEEKAWGLEHVVDMTAAYFERKRAKAEELKNARRPLE
jgi:hypothetical protein